MELKQMNELRTIRGYSIIAKGVNPKVLDMDTYLIPSQNGNGKYLVRNNGYGFTCQCPDFKYRRIDCKHIHAIKFWLKIKERINQLNAFEIKQELAHRCVYCYSENIIKKDKRKTKSGIKQRYLCKDCGRKFVNSPIKRIKGNVKIVSLVLDLYFKGVSLRKIQDHLKQFYNLKITHAGIYKWIRRFMKIMNEYTDKIQPKLSGKWQADEQMINSKGEWKWCWNVLDEDTRFLIANQVTKKRSVKDARKVFTKAKQITNEKPESISTDGLWSYEKAIKKEFIKWRHPQTEHIRLAGISKKRNNNKIERFHGSFRERDKVMRGFKGQEQAIANGFRTYYNFIRPHQALNGLTPSEVANINLNLNGNKWIGLLNRAINSKYDGLTLTTPMVLTGKKRKKPRKTRPKKIKTIYKVRIFSDGKEYENKEKKFKTEFKSEEKAKEFIEFYKLFYPNFEFKIEKSL